MAKPKRATWFKMFSHQRAAIDCLCNEDVGAGLKAAFAYFDGEDVPELRNGAFLVFAIIKPYLDEACNDYIEAVENGKAGADKRWSK